MGSLPEIAGLRIENISNKRLRIPVNDRKPGALYLHHDPMPLTESVVLRMKAERVFEYASGSDWLRMLEALPVASTKYFV